MRICRAHSIPALALYLLALSIPFVTAAGAVEHMPPKINYQGYITDNQGKPLTGPHHLTFRLYDAQEGGNLLWTEDHPAVSINDGAVDVVLGGSSPITADIVTPPVSPMESFFDLFLDITVDGEILHPRTLLASTPYALMTGRVDGDITTAPGGVLIEEQVGLNYQKIKWETTGGQSKEEMEASDGFSITKVIDKATPLLYKSLAMRKSSVGSDSMAIMGLIESDTIWFSASAKGGTAMTTMTDKSSPKLFESRTESGEGAEITKRIDKASPKLYESLTESTDGASISKQYDKASPKLAGWNMSVNKGGFLEGDSALMSAQVDTAAARLGLTTAGSGHQEEIVLNTLSTGPGSRIAAITMKNAIITGEKPPDTNLVMLATSEGGSMAISNIGSTAGDGLRAEINDIANSLRLRHGGANTGVYLEANPSAGGRMGINNEAPTEALQVSGNICASGTIGVCSDLRFKTGIDAISGALDKIAALRGVSFCWRQDQFPAQRFSSGRQVGFIAQEIEPVLPEVVLRGGDGYYSIDYGKLTPLLVEALKELKTQNDELKHRIEVLERSVR
jgi:type VI protein secretion system component Hcp